MKDVSINAIAATLSPAQQRIAVALFTGASNKEIARELGMADGTVKVHLKAIFGKIGVKNRTQAVLKLLPYAAAVHSEFLASARAQFRAELAMDAEFSGPLVGPPAGALGSAML
jgi:DNA-binding CsgD family transcriptional regulator